MIGRRLFIHAPNIHQGGGKVLLSALLDAVTPEMSVVLHADTRLHDCEHLSENVQVFRFSPTLQDRWRAERRLCDEATNSDLVLCFNGLPPLFKNKAKVKVFLQNRYLIDSFSLKGMPFKVALRISLERLWFKLKYMNADELIVQTSSMLKKAEQYFTKKVTFQAQPFLPDLTEFRNGFHDKANIKYDFIYIASGDAHKNHQRLLEAWCLLAEENMFPRLCLTFDPIVSPALQASFERMKTKFNLKMDNLSTVDRACITQLYQQTHAVIFPSLLESFGLPLIEARMADLPILASELDYVRDVVEPVQTFDPYSAVSIARAVKRFLKMEVKLETLLDAKEFLHHLLSVDQQKRN